MAISSRQSASPLVYVTRYTAIWAVPFFVRQQFLVYLPEHLGEMLAIAPFFHFVERSLELIGQAPFVGLLTHGPRLLHVNCGQLIECPYFRCENM